MQLVVDYRTSKLLCRCLKSWRQAALISTHNRVQPRLCNGSGSDSLGFSCACLNALLACQQPCSNAACLQQFIELTTTLTVTALQHQPSAESIPPSRCKLSVTDQFDTCASAAIAVEGLFNAHSFALTRMPEFVTFEGAAAIQYGFSTMSP